MGTATLEPLKKRHRILVLESDQDVRDTILTTLKKSNYAVAEAADSEEAVVLLGANGSPSAISVILCDIRAPKIKGVEAAAYFRVRYSHIPVIITAAYPDIEWAITLMKRGASDYLVKPVSKDDLLMVLKNALDRYVMVSRGS